MWKKKVLLELPRETKENSKRERTLKMMEMVMLRSYVCGKMNHLAKDCRHRKGQKNNEQANMVESDFVSVLFEICLVSNVNLYLWIDSGATCHVTPNRSLFKTYEAVKELKAIYMDNASTS